VEQLQRELGAIEVAKSKAEGRVEAVMGQVAAAEAAAARYEVELLAEREAREDATAAVMKLQQVIMGVKEEMESASEAASCARVELQAERDARGEAEEVVALLRRRLTALEDELAATKVPKPGPKPQRTEEATPTKSARSSAKAAKVEKLRKEINALKEAQAKAEHHASIPADSS
jgi:chromosome segregation ATPase